MAGAPKLGFSSFSAPGKGVLVIFADADLAFGPSTKKLLASTGDLVSRAAEADGFKGKNGQRARSDRAAGIEGLAPDRDRDRQGLRTEGRKILSSWAAAPSAARRRAPRK